MPAPLAVVSASASVSASGSASSAGPRVAVSGWERHVALPAGSAMKAGGGTAEARLVTLQPAGKSAVVVERGRVVSVFPDHAFQGWLTRERFVATSFQKGDVVVVDATTGAKRTMPQGAGSPFPFKEWVLFSTPQGPVTLVDPDTGKAKHRLEIGASSVVPFDDGRVGIVHPVRDAVTIASSTLAVERELKGTMPTVLPSGEVRMGFRDARGKLRLRIVEGGRERTSPVVPLAGELEDELKRTGSHVYTVVQQRVVHWDLDADRISVIAPPSNGADIQITGDGQAVCVGSGAAVIDAKTGRLRRDARCGVRLDDKGDPVAHAVSLGKFFSKAEPVFTTFFGVQHGVSVADTFTFIEADRKGMRWIVTVNLPTMTEVRRADASRTNAIAPIGSHAVLESGFPARVFEVRAPFRAQPIDGLRFPSLRTRHVIGEDVAVDVETFEVTAPLVQPDMFADVTVDGIALTSGRVLSLSGKGVLGDARRPMCFRGRSAKGHLLEVACRPSYAAALVAPDGTKTDLQTPPGSFLGARLTTTGRVLYRNEGGWFVLGHGTPPRALTGQGAFLDDDGRTFVLAERGDVPDTDQPLRAPPSRVLAASPDGTVLVTDTRIRTGQGALVAELPEPARLAAISPDGKLAAAVGARRVRVFDLHSGELVLSMSPSSPNVSFLGFHGGDLVVGHFAAVELVSLTTGATGLVAPDGGSGFVRADDRGLVALVGKSEVRVVCRKRGATEPFEPCP